MSMINIKGDYQKKLELLEEISSSCGIELTGSDTFREILEKETFDIAFVGEFTAGKSTLINALLGDDILPTALEATTARITFIKYDRSPGIALHFVDGSIEEPPFSKSTLKDLTAANALKLLNIEFISLHYPSGLLQNNIRFIDTPGTNDTEVQRINLTYKILPMVDAVVYVTIYPVTENNLCTFNELVLENRISSIFYLLNKQDLIEGQLQDALADAQYWFSQKTGSEITMYPVSALDYLDGILNADQTLIEKSRLEPFLVDLKDFLKGSEKYIRQEKQFDYHLNKLKLQLIDLISVSLAGLSLPEAQFTLRTADFEKKLSGFVGSADGLKEDIISEFNRLSAKLEKSLDKMLIDIIDEIDLRFSQGSSNDQVLVRTIEMAIKSRYETWMIRNEPVIRKYLETITEEVQHRLGEVVNAITISLFDYFEGFPVRLSGRNMDLSEVDDRKATATIGIMSLGAYAGLAIAQVSLAPLAILLGPIGLFLYHEKRKQERELLKDNFLQEIQKSSVLFKSEVLRNVLSMQHILFNEIDNSVSTFSDLTHKQLVSIKEERNHLKDQLNQKISHLHKQLERLQGL